MLPEALFDMMPGHSNPLGNVRRASNLLLAADSHAAFTGATNLLTKARRALANQDQDRACSYLRRAMAIPFDSFEERLPATVAARMMLFDMVTDALEASDEDDGAWLDAAVSVLSRASVTGRADLQHVLTDIVNDYSLPAREERITRHAIADRDETIPEIEDIDTDPAYLTEGATRVRHILEVCNDYEQELALRGPSTVR